ncbi:MAG: hypothetical protein ACFFCI_11085 [Promethearchaeota archaeon]
MLEYRINELLTLKLENGKTNLYVKGKMFIQCKRLVLNISKQDIPNYDEIDSIDEAADKYKHTLWQNKIVEGPMARPSDVQNETITPEQEFWGHCSNIQAWVENNYDTRLLHSNLAFPLLKALVDAGDSSAKKMLSTEIVKRLKSGHPNVIRTILSAGLLDYLPIEERKLVVQQNVSIILDYIENILKPYPDSFLYVFKEKLLDYLTPEEKGQLIQLNYHNILEFITNYFIYRVSWLNVIRKSAFFVDLIDYLDQKELKKLIRKNFPLILSTIEKIQKHQPNLFLYFFDERLLNYLGNYELKSLVQQNYIVILDYLRKTSIDNPDKFFYFYERGVLNYLDPKEKSKLISQNYSIIFKGLQKLMNQDTVKERVVSKIFEDGIFDYLNSDEKRRFIEQNFSVVMDYINKKPRNSVIYAAIINAIKDTNLLDVFFNTVHCELGIMVKAFQLINTSDDIPNDTFKKWRDVWTRRLYERDKEREELWNWWKKERKKLD